MTSMICAECQVQFVLVYRPVPLLARLQFSLADQSLSVGSIRQLLQPEEMATTRKRVQNAEAL